MRYKYILELSEKSRCVRAVLFPLRALSWIYRFVVYIRRVYLRSLRRSRRLSIPVITVGNITVGGTGKTPCILLLLSHLQGSIGYVSRGYKRRLRAPYVGRDPGFEQVGDEAMLIANSYPGTYFSISHNKWQALCDLDSCVDLAIVDDGLQRHDIPFDIRIATIDCRMPDGYGYLLPRGLLREPFSWVFEADYIVLTHARKVPPSLLAMVASKPVVMTEPVITGFVTASGEKRIVESGREIALFSSIAHPEHFAQLMHRMGYCVVDHYIVGDHLEIKDEELICYADRVRSLFPEAYIIGTEKDWVKKERWPQLPVLFSCMKLRVIRGHDVVEDLVKKIRVLQG